ncbi:MAG: nucleotide exchange factor GrpE [Phycisphaerae bacterium]
MSDKKRKDNDRQQDQPEQEPNVRKAPENIEALDPMDVLQQERDDLFSRLQRVSADYMNYQKRVQRDVQQARDFANEQLIKELLAVVDNMERALDAAAKDHDSDDPLLQGMQLVHDSFMDVLSRYGVQRIEAEGKPFDPAMHSAMMEQPSSEVEPMTVLQEVQKGYQLKGRTIRPASVIVAKAPEENTDEAGE